MKFFSIVIFFFCFNINLFSQDFPSEIWHKGWLVTNQKDTLNGFVKYNFENQLIQVKVDNTIKAFSNRNIYYFEIFDNTIEDYRQFYSLMYEINYNYSIPILFEVLIKGKLTLLIKEKIVSETVPRYFPSYYSYGRTYYEQYNKLEYDFFFTKQYLVPFLTPEIHNLQPGEIPRRVVFLMVRTTADRLLEHPTG